MDYIVYEVLPGKTLSDVLKRFNYQHEADEWCKKNLKEWKFNAGVNKEYVVYIHGTKAAHHYWHPDGSQIDEYWHRNGSMVIEGTSKGLL